MFIASLGPKNVEVTAEVADGWIPVFFHPDKANDVWGGPLAKGLANCDASLPALSIVAGGTVAIVDDEDEARKIRDGGRFMTALLRRGHGSQGEELLQRPVPELRLRGGGGEDPGPVPRRSQGRGDGRRAPGLPRRDRHGRFEGQVRERIEAYAAAGVTHLQVTPAGPDPSA
ncbi:MAG: LLM class flavin-dependent oxidoreductase [Acidimicrobiales bacterium]